MAMRKTSAVRRTQKRTVIRAAVAAPPASGQVLSDCINTVRFLAIDSINKSNSGHPGLPMGCAPMGYGATWRRTNEIYPQSKLFRV